MRIKNIKIENLFGLEDNNFDIDINFEDPITLLFGFNGIGKTTIIKLVKACLTCDLRTLRLTKFNNIIISFDDSSILSVIRNTFFEPEEDLVNCWMGLSGMQNHPISFEYKNSQNNRIEYILQLVDFKSIESQFDEDIKITDEFVYGVNDRALLNKESIKKLNKLENILSEKINLHTIFSTKKHAKISNNWQIHTPFSENDEIIIFTYDRLKELQKRINIALAVYDEYPKEDVKSDESNQFELISVEIPFVDKLEEVIAFIKDNFDNPLYQTKFNLLKTIINEDFGLLYKELDFDYRNGIVIKPIVEQDGFINYKKLSFGEKNLICLFFELIFYCKEHSTIFIDEPETSFHLDWQKQLVESIQQVCELNKMQVVILTHSPDVVDKYIFFTHELKSERFKNARFFKN